MASSEEPAGVVFPVATDGRRSTTALGKAVAADALRRVNAAAAQAAVLEASWRPAYPVHFRRLIEAGLASRDAEHRQRRPPVAPPADAGGGRGRGRRFGVEVFEPDTCRVLMAALLVHDLYAGSGTERAHPWQDEAKAAAHGGLVADRLRCPQRPHPRRAARLPSGPGTAPALRLRSGYCITAIARAMPTVFP